MRGKEQPCPRGAQSECFRVSGPRGLSLRSLPRGSLGQKMGPEAQGPSDCPLGEVA